MLTSYQTGWYVLVNVFSISLFSLFIHSLMIFSKWIFIHKHLCSHNGGTLGISCTHPLHSPHSPITNMGLGTTGSGVQAHGWVVAVSWPRLSFSNNMSKTTLNLAYPSKTTLFRKCTQSNHRDTITMKLYLYNENSYAGKMACFFYWDTERANVCK